MIDHDEIVSEIAALVAHCDQHQSLMSDEIRGDDLAIIGFLRSMNEWIRPIAIHGDSVSRKVAALAYIGMSKVLSEATTDDPVVH